MKTRIKSLLGVMTILAVMLLVAGCAVNPSYISVNGFDITYRDYTDYLNATKAIYEEQQPGLFESEDGEAMQNLLKQQVIQYMISEAIVEQEARQQGVYPTNAEIEAEIASVSALYGSEAEFKQALQSSGTTMKEYREDMAIRLAVDNLVKIIGVDETITEEEVQEYYDNNKDSFVDQDGKAIAYEDVKGQLTDSLLQNKQNEAFNAYINEVASKAIIKYNPEYSL